MYITVVRARQQVTLPVTISTCNCNFEGRAAAVAFCRGAAAQILRRSSTSMAAAADAHAVCQPIGHFQTQREPSGLKFSRDKTCFPVKHALASKETIFLALLLKL